MTFPEHTDTPDHTEDETLAEKTVSAEPTPVPSYKIALKGTTSIHSGPGTEYEFISTIGADGTFTIVEESADSDGNIWGKLKSGAGWVNITLVGSYTVEKANVTAYYADDELINSGNFLEYTDNTSEYAVKIAFCSDKRLEKIRITSLTYSGSYQNTGYSTADVLYTLERLPKDTVLVLNVNFFGDATTYGISFADTDNSIRYFSLNQSGKDGSLIFSEYYP